MSEHTMQRHAHPMMFLLLLTLLLSTVRPASSLGAGSENDSASVLPFVTTDAVVTRHPVTGKTTREAGVIEDLAGNEVQLRRAGGRRVDHIYLRDIADLQFRKSAEHDAGLLLLAEGNWEKALTALDSAAQTEQRDWVQREVQASAAATLLALKRHTEVIERIEKIAESDPDTRHVGLLPLVWDERLPPEERFQSPPSDMKSPSLIRRLTAASSLLQNPRHETAAIGVLTELRKCEHPRIQELAEIQLWRLEILKPEELRKSDVRFRQLRTTDFDQQIRGAAEFVTGRALMQQFDFDAAALCLMWMPAMTPADRATAAASLNDAAVALTKSGQIAAAAQVRQELLSRFPETSTARRVAAAEPESPSNP
jgi:tetratricopeptide (TPR) repeat protein